MSEEIQQRQFVYLGSRNRPSAGTVHVRSSGEGLPVIVLAHGFKGFKDWGFLPPLAETFAQAGYYVCRFNFSHNGCSVDGREEVDLDAFRENRLSFEAADLSLLLEQLREGETAEGNRADWDRIILVGHSRGGSAVLQCAGEEGVCGVALLASISRYPSVSPEEAAAWMEAGVTQVVNWRTGTKLSLGLGLLAELVEDRALLERTIRALRIPICIIHGDADETVQVHAAQELASWAENKELHILPSANHTFGGKHPFSGWTPDLEKVRAIILDFAGRVH